MQRTKLMFSHLMIQFMLWHHPDFHISDFIHLYILFLEMSFLSHIFFLDSLSDHLLRELNRCLPNILVKLINDMVRQSQCLLYLEDITNQLSNYGMAMLRTTMLNQDHILLLLLLSLSPLSSLQDYSFLDEEFLKQLLLS